MIKLEHVSKAYSAGIPALNDVNLEIGEGEFVFVVGDSGSGKSTLIKLLLKELEPTDGMITINGKKLHMIRHRQVPKFRRNIGVVFQDFRLFSLPLGENVAADCHYDREKVERCLWEAGLGERLEQMPEGLDVYLYKDYEDGVEISGGEAQKIAIARALCKDAPFILLDEPTAALDPISEYEIYRGFDRIAERKTAIYISHRLSSCRFCEKIAVFHEGRIVQTGSHEALLKDEGGKYLELWNAQAQYYQ